MKLVLGYMVDHRFTRTHASEYLDGELSSAGRRRIEHHTSVCPKCRTFVASLRRIVAELPRLSRVPQANVAEGVLERLRAAG